MKNFEKHAHEANAYINTLASELGHPESVGQTLILLRAVLHTLRDRITINESLHLLSQLPLILKGVYVEHWEHRENPLEFHTLEEFKKAVEHEQTRHGEHEFNWDESTDKLVSMVLTSLGTHFLTNGQLQHVAAQMPKEVQALFPVKTEKAG